jgi:hypothetical protein
VRAVLDRLTAAFAGGLAAAASLPA